MTLQGQTAVITGASQGFGRAVAEAFCRAGAHLVLCARSGDVLSQTRDDIAAHAAPGQEIVATVADVAKPADVEQLTALALQRFGRVHVLVNNAGVFGPMGALETVDWTEWVRTIEINLFGVALPCRALLPHFRQHGYGRIINLSGGGATSPMPNITAYAASKAAVVRLTETLAEETRGTGITVNAVAPGAMNTRMIAQAVAAGPSTVGPAFHQRMVQVAEGGGAPLERGADLCVFLATEETADITGKLISAVWDPWNELPQRVDDLRGDVYTLRRIVPKDRGMTWGDP